VEEELGIRNYAQISVDSKPFQRPQLSHLTTFVHRWGQFDAPELISSCSLAFQPGRC
jgi:hypothetical protein